MINVAIVCLTILLYKVLTIIEKKVTKNEIQDNI